MVSPLKLHCWCILQYEQTYIYVFEYFLIFLFKLCAQTAGRILVSIEMKIYRKSGLISLAAA